MAKIFISYRREDSQWPADRIYEALQEHVPDPRSDIFIDVDNVPLGVDFVAHLDERVSQCEVLLALIGPKWLDIRDPETGKRRLDDPKDFVRVEIASALKRGLPVIPIFLDDVPPPEAAMLPEELAQLSTRNGVDVRRLTFEADVRRLIDGLYSTGVGLSAPKKIKVEETAGLAPSLTDAMPRLSAEAKVGIKKKGEGVYWRSISESLLAEDYHLYLELFPRKKRAADASLRLRLLARWADIDKNSSSALKSLLKSARQFPALKREIQYHQRNAKRPKLPSYDLGATDLQGVHQPFLGETGRRLPFVPKAEDAQWRQIKDSTLEIDYTNYARAHPSSEFAPTAQRRRELLERWHYVDKSSLNELKNFQQLVKDFPALNREIRFHLGKAQPPKVERQRRAAAKPEEALGVIAFIGFVAWILWQSNERGVSPVVVWLELWESVLSAF